MAACPEVSENSDWYAENLPLKTHKYKQNLLILGAMIEVILGVPVLINFYLSNVNMK